jgi:hypothetical protein
MKQVFIIAIAFLSLEFFYAANAAPGKTFIDGNKISVLNAVQYFTKSPGEMPVKSAWVKKDVVISWQTIAEVNTLYFEIQRSFNGKDYESIERITAKRNSNNIAAYLSVDSQNENRRGKSYYRLKAVFANGEEAFSTGAITKKTGVFDMNQGYAKAAGLDE